MDKTTASCSSQQLVDVVPFEVYSALRKELAGITLVQVIHVIDEDSVEEAKSVSPFVDMILLDSGNPKLAVKELGGTGRRHNWELSKKIVGSAGKPVFLAGGLNAGNVREAIDVVGPYGLDLCNGVRFNGQLDQMKLRNLFEAMKIQ